MEFVDTHCHFSDSAFRGEEDSVIRKALDAGVTGMLQADVDSHERPGMFELTGRYPGILYPMLGLYPGSVDEGWRDEMDELMKCTDRDVVAIGEIGLDYHYGAQFRREQMEVLHLQFELAASLDLPVNIHLREATDDFFKVMDDCRHLHLRGNLHAFSGSFETFGRLSSYGEWYVGIGGVLTFKNSKLPDTVRRIPLDRILLETDSPYLAPVPLRGTRNDSSNIPLIASAIAGLKGLSIEEVASVTTSNAKKLFRI